MLSKVLLEKVDIFDLNFLGPGVLWMKQHPYLYFPMLMSSAEFWAMMQKQNCNIVLPDDP